MLTAPVRMVFEANGAALPAWTTSGVRFMKRAAGSVSWESDGAVRAAVGEDARADGIRRQPGVRGRGAARPSRPRSRTSGSRSPSAREVAKFMMGMGVRGGRRPLVRLEVGRQNNQDSAWLGDVNAGLQVTLKDDKYSRPLNTNFYHSKPLVMPASWANDGPRRVPPHRAGRHGARPVLQRPAGDAEGRGPALRLPPAADAVPPARHEGAVRDALLPRLHADCRGRRDRREHAQHPPRQRDQPVHQLPLPPAGADEGLHRRGATRAA